MSSTTINNFNHDAQQKQKEIELMKEELRRKKADNNAADDDFRLERVRDKPELDDFELIELESLPDPKENVQHRIHSKSIIGIDR